jgi:hypothetical protein
VCTPLAPPGFLKGIVTPGAYTEEDRVELRDLATRMLIDNHRLQRAGSGTRMHLLLHVRTAIDHAADAGWDRGNIHIEADRTWGQWLIDNAGQSRKPIVTARATAASCATKDRGLRDAAIHALVTHDKQIRAGMVLSDHLDAIVQRALDDGWSSSDIHAEADRRYGQWLIASAGRDEQAVYATTFEELAAKHGALIGRIIGHNLPRDLHPNGIIAAIHDARGTLPDIAEWAYDRECLDLAAEYLGDALISEDDVEGAARAADEALALVDIDAWTTATAP